MKYYIIENDAPKGPFEVPELLARGLRSSDLVWSEGMSDWVAAETVDELRRALFGPRPVCEGMPAPPPAAPQPSYQQTLLYPEQPQYPQQPQYQQPPYQQPPYQQPPYQQPQQQPYQQQQQTVPPDNGLVAAILVTLFCCLPFGVVAIIKASSVNNLWNSGQYDQAYEAAASAKKWSIVSAVCGVVGGLLYAGLVIFGGLMDSL